MLSISKRGFEMPASPIRKLVPYAEAAKKRGIKVYHLNIGQPDIETPASILDAVRNCNIKVLEYSHSAGNESYRKKLVQYYGKNKIHISSDQVIITTGGSEAILFGFMACLDAGDEVPRASRAGERVGPHRLRSASRAPAHVGVPRRTPRTWDQRHPGPQ